jgi:hypothetical protein
MTTTPDVGSHSNRSFLDIAYGLAGPAAGLVAGQFGYAAVYLLGTVSALLGAALVIASRSTSA